MADYQFDSILVADPVTFHRAPNASVTVYDIADTDNATPLTLKDLNGLPLPNPLTSSADAFLPPFTTTSPHVKLVAGTLAVAQASYKAVLDEARTAKTFVQGIGVKSTTTGEAGTQAAAAIDANGQFTFTIPKGDKGAPGDQGIPGVWSPEFQAQQQGFWAIYSATPPAQTEMYGVPVVWMTPAQAPIPVPVLPQAPLWNDTTTNVTIPTAMVGIEYQNASGGVLPQGSVVPGMKGQDFVVKAVALPGYVLPTTYQWRHKFLDPAKATLVASDTFSGPRAATVVGRTLDNLVGGSAAQVWRGYQMGLTPLWSPPNLDWRGGGYTGLAPSGVASLRYAPVGAPIDPSVTTSATGGTLPAGTYWYMVTAVMAVGETGCKNQKSIVTTGATSSNTIAWPAVSAATSIRIWRWTSAGQEKLLATIQGSATSYVDDGSATVGTVTPPYQNDDVNFRAGLLLSTQWQRVKVDVSGITSVNDTVQVAFRAPSNWTGYFVGYSVIIQYSRLTFGVGRDTPDQAVTDGISFTFGSDANGTWDVYIIGDSISALAPNGQLYTTTVKPYLASTSAQDRVAGNGLAVKVAGSAEVKNFKVYEVGA